MMKYDDLIRYIGEFGTFQKRVYCALCLFGAFHAMRMVVMVFVIYVPRHRCAVPDLSNDTYQINGPSHETTVNMTVPVGDLCHVYAPGNYTYDENNRPINASLTKCDRWVYDTSVMTNTLTSQLDLVCDDSTKTSLSTMVFFFGYFIGTYVLGALSDGIGRKSCLYISVTSMIIFGVAQACSNDFIVFTCMGFFTGIASIGIFPTAYVIGLELVGPSKRTKVGMTLQIFFAIGVVVLAGMAYLIRDWRYLLMSITVPVAVTLIMWGCIPESPRWQIQKGHFRKARKTLLKAAAINKQVVPEWALDRLLPVHDSEDASDEVSQLNLRQTENYNNGGSVDGSKLTANKNGRFIDLFRSKVLLSRTIVVFFNWFVIFFTFFSLTFNLENVGAGSIHLNVCVAGLVELPGYVLALLFIDKFGRRHLLCTMLTLSGLACLGCVVSIAVGSRDDQWLTLVLVMVGRLGVAGAVSIIYIYSAELFPTVIRTSAIGASSSWARVGSMLAPYMAAQGARTEGSFYRAVPMLICGCLTISAGLASLLLPETTNRSLPETVEDAKHFTSVSSDHHSQSNVKK